MILRDYQQRAVDAVSEMLDAGLDPLLVAPTGAGKTPMLAAIAKRTPGAVFALAHRRELVEQIRRTFQTFDRGLQAETWNALKGWQPRPKVDLLIIDEAHHASIGTVYASLIRELRERNPRMRVLGTTATPWRLDGKALTLFNAHYVAATPRELLERGVLVGFQGFAYRSVDTDGIPKVAGDYAQGKLSVAASRPQLLGDIVTRWKQTASTLSTLAFAVNVEHARSLAAMFKAQGVNAQYLTGTDSQWLRNSLFAQLANKRINVLVNVAIATEGVDIPSLECLILARPTLSETLALQMIGRVLRSHPGKTHARIHDHAQVILSHGSPYADRDWSPRAERKRGAASGGGSQQICPECLALMSASAWQCGECGAAMRERRAVVSGKGVEIPLDSHARYPEAKHESVSGFYNGTVDAGHVIYDEADGECVALLPRCTVLDKAFDALGRPQVDVRVTYLGERRSGRGFKYHDYRVEDLSQALSARELELLREG